MLLLRPPVQMNVVPFDNQMLIGWRDKNPPVLDVGSVLRVHGNQGTGSGEDLGQETFAPRVGMHHDKYRRGQIPGKLLHQSPKCFDASRRGPNDDDVVFWHVYALIYLGRRIGTSTVILVPSPGSDSMPNAPCIIRARSSMLTSPSPERLACMSNPSPKSI